MRCASDDQCCKYGCFRERMNPYLYCRPHLEVRLAELRLKLDDAKHLIGELQVEIDDLEAAL